MVWAAVVFLSSPATAQTGDQPTLVFTLYAGTGIGHSLWRVGKQPLCLLGGSPSFPCSGNYDTLALSRTVGSGLVGGLSATIFPRSHIGWQIDVGYSGMPLESGCTGLYFYADADHKNEQLCGSIAASQVASSAISVLASMIARAAPRGATSPFLRAGVGLTSMSRSAIPVEGEFALSGPGGTQTFSRSVVVDNARAHISVSYLVGAGITAPLGPGYQFRLEARDILASVKRVTGPADALGLAPTSSKYYHHITLAMGLDVVLEKKRGRRY
jgi:hypothetical protein